MTEFVSAALAGQRRALAHLLSLVEEGAEESREIIARLYPHTGQAHIVGITGAPGSGKSTLVSQIAAEYRRRKRTVGIVAVDPSSPFSGGALLGDRIRMRALSGDPGIFIRSMASRGSLGGLARSTRDVVLVLDACGYQRILIETVGAGQTEVDIASAAHTTLVIQVPGAGDDIQALKAGLLEIADILVVNKGDQPGAERMVALLQSMLDLRSASPSPGESSWRPPVLKTVATAGQGAAETVDAVEQHMAYLGISGRLQERQRARLADELRALLQEELLRRALAQISPQRYQAFVESVLSRRTDPYSASQELLREICPQLEH